MVLSVVQKCTARTVACRGLWSKSQDWHRCSMNGKVHMWSRSSRRKNKQRSKESHGLTAEDVTPEATRSNALSTSWQVTSAEDPRVVTRGWQQGHSTLNMAFPFSSDQSSYSSWTKLRICLLVLTDDMQIPYPRLLYFLVVPKHLMLVF